MIDKISLRDPKSVLPLLEIYNQLREMREIIHTISVSFSWRSSELGHKKGPRNSRTSMA
jgi:hypothetical protein